MLDNTGDLRFRVNIILVIVAVLCGVLIVNLYVLQIRYSGKYLLLSDKNRIRLSPVLPKRGRIITADGKTVASNVHKHRLIIERCDKKTFSENMDILSRCIKLSEDEKKHIFNLRDKLASYLPVVIKDNLSWEELSKVSMLIFKLKNVSIENDYIRDYSLPLEFSHVLGYTARSDDSTQVLIGKTGLESVLNNELIGSIGSVQTEVNSLGKKMRVIDYQEPINGKDVIISINSELQKYVYDLIFQEKAGGCVVINISTGEILALVSVPGFDTNAFSNKITRKQWEDLRKDELFPLLNRVVSCAYPPGSVFKIVVAFAALEKGIISENDKIFCSGGMKLDNHTFHCWNRDGHGWMNLSDALKLSCDCYFFEIAKRLGIDNIVEYAKKFGYGSETDIELPNENVGLLPTKKWKFLRYGTSWKPYETIIAGIGQGALLSTLMQAANMMGKVYTDNYGFKSTLIKGKNVNSVFSPISKRGSDIIKNALHQVCTCGTAARACNTSYGISGKTGSSQVRRLKDNEAGKSSKYFQWKHRDHAFFVGCAPYKNPRYVVAVFIEHGGGGAAVAAPVARKVFDKLMETENENK